MDFRYAFLLLSMSLEEAKQTLGFKPDDHPSPEEVKQAWKKKIFEVHPDRGGSHDQALAVNVAKDILEGKARPSYDRRDAPTPQEPPAWAQEPPATRWEPPKPKEVTFEEAKSKAGVPHADWLFVTDTQRGKGWMSDESSQSDYGYAFYGRTDTKYVFVGAREFTRRDYFIGGGRDENVWTMKVLEFPIKGDEGKNPAWVYGNVVKALKAAGFEGRFNSKVRDLSGKNWVFSEKFPALGAATSIKHWLVESGQVAGEDPSVAGRKHVIELFHEPWRPYGDDKVKPGYYEEPHERFNFWDGKYHGDYHKFQLIINGKPYDFSEAETQRFLKLKLGGKRILYAIFGDYPRGGKKILTRLRAGKPILTWLAENLNLPQQSKDIVANAAAGMK